MIYESWIFWRENVGKIELVSASRRLSFCFPPVSSFEMICIVCTNVKTVPTVEKIKKIQCKSWNSVRKSRSTIRILSPWFTKTWRFVFNFSWFLSTNGGSSSLNMLVFNFLLRSWINIKFNPVCVCFFFFFFTSQLHCCPSSIKNYICFTLTSVFGSFSNYLFQC